MTYMSTFSYFLPGSSSGPEHRVLLAGGGLVTQVARWDLIMHAGADPKPGRGCLR